MSEQLELLSPVAQVGVERLARAPRLRNLDNRVVVLLDNTKQNTDAFMDCVEQELLAGTGVQRVQRVRKDDSARPAADLGDLARTADAVINGIGD